MLGENLECMVKAKIGAGLAGVGIHLCRSAAPGQIEWLAHHITQLLQGTDSSLDLIDTGEVVTKHNRCLRHGQQFAAVDQKFIAGFALGIGSVGKRQWVDVYVSEDRARDLQAQVEDGLIRRKSDVVVVGFPKEKTVMKEGKEHTRRWINAVAIKPKLLSDS